MKQMIAKMILGCLVPVLMTGVAQAKVEKFKIDGTHSSVHFKAQHFGAGNTWGRFNKISGDFVVDTEKAANGKVNFMIDARSVDTHSKKRDDHLRGPDFLGAKEFPQIKFSSTSVVKKNGGKYEVKGNLKLHGKTKAITLIVEMLGRGNDPWGNVRIGMDTNYAVALSDFAIKGMKGAVSEKISLMISIEGVRKK